MKLSLDLYRDSRTEFLAIAKKIAETWDRDSEEAFFQSFDHSKLKDYKEFITLLEDLLSVNFISYGITNNFISRSIEFLHDAYMNNKLEYIDFIQGYNVEYGIATKLLKEKYHNFYLLCNFLPSLYKFPEIQKDCLFGQHGFSSVSYLLAGTNDEDYNRLQRLTIKAIKVLVEISSDFMELFISQGSFVADDSFIEHLAHAVINSNRKIDIDKISSNLRHSIIEIEGWKVFDIQSDRPSLDSKYEVLSKNGSAKKALVIYGADYNKAFSNSKTEIDLVNSDYQVLLIDARKKIITVQDIANIIKGSGFSNLEEIYLNMHGSDAWLVHDTLLTLNGENSYDAHKKIMAKDLFKIIVKEIEEKPLKIMVSSCHSQLLTHKITTVLPAGSEIVTLSEDQVINGEHYVYDNQYEVYTNVFYGKNTDIRMELAQSVYYFSHPSFVNIQSITYVNLGKCNFRTPVNINKKDIKELFLKKTIEEIVSSVVRYLDNGEENQENITNAVIKLLKLIENSNELNPLLSYRENHEVNQDFTKLLGVASAIYGIYDQCGEKVISDGDFVPTEDHFLAEYTMSFVMNAPAFISNNIIHMAGKLISNSADEL
jgi:hypothetical protein